MEMENKKVIIRAKDAGVFFGTLESLDANGVVTLTNCRRLWYWSGANSLSQLAMEGVKNPERCKFSVGVSSITILGVIEVIPCTPEAIANIEEVPVWRID